MPKVSVKLKKQTIACTADRHEYYEKAVQCVEPEISFVDQSFLTLRGRYAEILREDFCGTAKTCCEWVCRKVHNRAIGLDLSQEVLDWGTRHNISCLNAHQQNRIELINADVLDYSDQRADMILAMNFSYQVFKTRQILGRYFQNAWQGLNEDGILFIDAYGGHESWREVKEKTSHEGFNYYWHQARFDPITSHMLCHIHFKFSDGSKMKKAFTYEWRMWTLPELQELMYEAGFSKVTVYWEGTDEESGKGNGEYYPVEHGQDDPCWIVYLAAEK